MDNLEPLIKEEDAKKLFDKNNIKETNNIINTNISSNNANNQSEILAPNNYEVIKNNTPENETNKVSTPPISNIIKNPVANTSSSSISTNKFVNDSIGKFEQPLKESINQKDINTSNFIYPVKKKSTWKSVLFWLFTVIIAFVLGYIIVNGPAFYDKIMFFFNSKAIQTTEITDPNTIVSDTVDTIENNLLPNNHLIIPSIGVDALVNWEIAQSDMTVKMLEGLAHYSGTSLPDQFGGNVFITGHSSNYWWIKSNYNHVFSLLDNLKIGDKVILTYKKNKYVYEVYDKFVVDPKQIEVLDSIEGKSTLTLMSCVPLGTNYKRLIVRSELLFTDKVEEKNPTNTTK